MTTTPTTWRPRESCHRADLEAARATRATCLRFFDGSRCAETLADIVGARVKVEIVRVHRGPPPEPIDGGIWLELAGEENLRLEVEADLAVAVTARALKRPPPKVRVRSEDGDVASLAGGLAAVAIAVSRRSPRGPLHVRGAGSTSARHSDLGTDGGSFDTAVLHVEIDDEAYAARLLMRPRASEPSDVAWSRDRLRALGETPLDLPVVLCACRAAAHEVASLEVGDAWMLGFGWGEGPGPRGSVVLAAPSAESGARAYLVETGALVLRPGTAELDGRDMAEQGENDPIVEAVGDVPVVVRVEVGAARMTAREWAALGPGDVVALARGVADPVTLRVGGVEVAKGELVEIEGEIGVRILRRLGGERAR